MKFFNQKNINRILFAGIISIIVMACERDVTDLQHRVIRQTLRCLSMDSAMD
jgi:hypothetical protein